MLRRFKNMSQLFLQDSSPASHPAFGIALGIEYLDPVIVTLDNQDVFFRIDKNIVRLVQQSPGFPAGTDGQ